MYVPFDVTAKSLHFITMYLRVSKVTSSGACVLL